jgi:hypothetical protein
MTKHDIEAALAEAKRFETRATEMLRRMKEYENKNGSAPPESGWWPMESGALKRASLDLTRSLAKMRRRAGYKTVWEQVKTL